MNKKTLFFSILLFSITVGSSIYLIKGNRWATPPQAITTSQSNIGDKHHSATEAPQTLKKNIPTHFRNTKPQAIIKEEIHYPSDNEYKNQLIFEHSYGTTPNNDSRIDKDLIDHAIGFRANFDVITELSVGENILIKLPYIGEGIEEKGTISKNELTSLTSSREVTVTFSNSGSYMTAFYTEGLIQGKIYSEKGTYIYESDGEHGYIMSIYDYKSLKQALIID